MLPYLLVLGFVMFWIALENKALNRKSFFLPLVALSLFAAIRSYRVGTDSGTYTRHFRSNLNIYNFEFEKGVELGYQILEYILLRLEADYFWLFLITGIIVVYCYLTTIKKYSVNYIFSIFLFITLGVYTFFFNGLRQGLGMAIFVLATPYLLERRFIPYLVICICASFFHTSALFMLPFYFLVNLRIKPLYKVLATFLGSLVVSRFLINYIATTNVRYESYTEVSEEAGGLLTLGFYTILMLFIYFIIRLYRIRDEYTIKLFTFYAVGVVFIIPVAMLGTMASGPQRLITYFTWTLILILPVMFRKINNIYITSLAVVLFLAYFVFTTTRFSNLTPYIINPAFRIL